MPSGDTIAQDFQRFLRQRTDERVSAQGLARRGQISR